MELKKRVIEYIEQNSVAIQQIGTELFSMPELGFSENKTAEYVIQKMKEIGAQDIVRCGKTGVKGYIGKKEKGKPCIAIIGELDAVICYAHPQADPTTGAAHACGHHAQLTAMLAAGAALASLGDELDACICLMATPAEEYIEIEKRLKLYEAKEIEYLGGKQQLIAEGAFEDIDIAMMVHAQTGGDKPVVVTHGSSLGFIGKTMVFKGKAAHAGAYPYLGVNALNAATLAIAAIHFQRETFKDEDKVRVHPIITKGGDVVNTVPDNVVMECFTRAGTIEAMLDANNKVNRAVSGAAYAIGADAQIEEMPGYLPLMQNDMLGDIFAENAANYLGQEAVYKGLPFSGSTDMGDLSWYLPAIQPTINGFAGSLHGEDFSISDAHLAYIAPAIVLACTAVDLLDNEAQKAKSIIKNQPRKRPEEYKALWKEMLGKQ